MRKKRLIAAVMAGTMVFSSIAYADIQGKEVGEYQQAAETEDAEETVVDEEVEKSAEDITESEEYDTVDDDAEDEALKVDESEAEESVDQAKKYLLATSSNASEDESEDEISEDEILDEELDAEEQEEENLVKTQTAETTVKIKLMHDRITKIYGADDPDLSTLIADMEFEFEDDSLGHITELTGVTWEREEGEKPGKYKITRFSCNEFPNIELDEESSWFIIEKKTLSKWNLERTISDNGKQQEFDLTKICDWTSEDKKPSKFILKEVSEEDKAKFVELPTVDESGILRFTLKQLGNNGTVTIPFTAEGEYFTYPENEELVIKVQPATALKTVATRTEEQIRAFYEENPFDINYADVWTVTPDAKNNIAGKLSEETAENALNTLNFVRYIAGLEAEVEINSEYTEKIQAGTTILQAANQLSHTPTKPSFVSQEFYELGYSGTQHSNLGMPGDLAVTIIYGWMHDGDKDNIDRVGHRRWCLNPSMAETGFGHSGMFTGMYTLDFGLEDIKLPSYVPWPAQTMPIDYFGGPWSVSLNKDELKVPDKNALKVTMTKQGGDSIVLNSSCTNKSGKYFNYSTENMGMGPAIVFTPDIRYAANDVVTVKIEGVQDKYGNETLIEYTVNFFEMGSSNSGSNGDSGNAGGNASGGSGSSSGSGGSHSSGGGGGSHSSGGGGGSSSGGGGGSTSKASSAGVVGGPGAGAGTLPSYVVKGNWKQTGEKWSFSDTDGKEYRNVWAAVENPYANTALGQSAFDWFRFDEAGHMQTGWVTEPDGNIYYLNPISDNTRGKMQTGWVWIPDATGVQKCYYFNPNSDGFRGKLMKNTVIDGYTVNAEGAWTVNGVVQTK